MEREEKYMQRCIELAQHGLGHVSPNPMVGAVIVCDGLIIGEGYHRKCGEAHAEVNAIRSVKDQSLLKRSTIYVSLEPCSHYGKTPPCVDLIIEKEIPRIVIGCQDPFSKVAGNGIRKLRDANREVIVGVMEKECRNLIRTFITAHTLHRPYITLKWAQSADGFIDKKRTSGQAAKLSTDLTTLLVHKRRVEIDGIMVGTHTALLDNPSLTVRHWYGNNPTRIIIDKLLEVSNDAAIYNREAPTIILNTIREERCNNIEYLKVDFNQNFISEVLTLLYQRNIHSLMIEGGAILLQSFIDAEIWDEAFVELSNLFLEEGVSAPYLKGAIDMSCEKQFGVDILHYKRQNAI